MKHLLLCCCLLLAGLCAAHTRQDTLRGSNGRGRDWWDVVRYELTLQIDTATRAISGENTITFRVTGTPVDSMQIDLQEGVDLIQPIPCSDAPLSIEYKVVREGNVCWIIKPAKSYKTGKTYTIYLRFRGKPREAKHPPWDGGFIWTKDSTDKPWIAVACQGLGASSWWPCKDYQGDEPDSGIQFWIDSSYRFRNAANFNPYNIISNGRFFDGDSVIVEDPITGKTFNVFSQEAFSWKTKNPINTYNTTFYIGDYVHWHDTLHGEKGILDLDFYPLKYNEAKAREQWAAAKEMLRCFEWWMGPYPFYEDGYKLVEAPYLGMEHQSAVAYGNQYKMGYLGKDRSGTGIGLAFDFIIIHESGHEWFGNSITARDIADNWLHEGFTTYTEALFAEWIKGKDSAFAYTTGEWKNIKNDRPVTGDYGVQDDGSNDKYDKGSAVVHMIRMMLNDDEKFRQLLRGLNRDFYHKIVTSREVEDYISRFTGQDLKPFFDMYLRSTEIPVMLYERSGDYYIDKPKHKVKVRLSNVPADFVLPVFSRKGNFLFNLSTKSQKITNEMIFQIQDYLIIKMQADHIN